MNKQSKNFNQQKQNNKIVQNTNKNSTNNTENNMNIDIYQKNNKKRRRFDQFDRLAKRRKYCI